LRRGQKQRGLRRDGQSRKPGANKQMVQVHPREELVGKRRIEGLAFHTLDAE
jgi:hypothetical protein